MMYDWERVSGGIYGLLIGDALGVPYEFHAAHQIPPADQIEMEPPPGFNRAHAGTPPATWSDDGAQALILLESLLERGQLHLDDFARRLIDWYKHGHMAVDGRVFDVGIQTAYALERLQSGVEPDRAGRSDERSNGNGSLMRVLPLALWHKGSDLELARDAALQSMVTHGHPRARVCCSLYCLWARYTLLGSPEAWQEAVSSLEKLCDSEQRRELDLVIAGVTPTGTGYVLDSLHSARWALRERSYEAVVKAAISLGNDTDTTACIAGGVAGIRYGNIPERWIQSLRGKQLLDPLIQKLHKWTLN